MKRYSNVTIHNLSGDLDRSWAPTVESTAEGAVLPPEPDVIRSDQDMDKVKTLVLVPDGTLCFCRPVGREGYDDKFVLTGVEVVWMKPNDDGIWEGIGPVSGHVYRHVGWMVGLIEKQQAKERAAEFQLQAAIDRAAHQQEWIRRTQTRRYRAKAKILSVWWRIRPTFRAMFAPLVGSNR